MKVIVYSFLVFFLTTFFTGVIYAEGEDTCYIQVKGDGAGWPIDVTCTGTCNTDAESCPFCGYSNQVVGASCTTWKVTEEGYDYVYCRCKKPVVCDNCHRLFEYIYNNSVSGDCNGYAKKSSSAPAKDWTVVCSGGCPANKNCNDKYPITYPPPEGPGQETRGIPVGFVKWCACE